MSSLGDAARKLQGRYIEGLPAKWRVVKEALTQLRSGDPDAEDTLRRVAHQVRGSAASFGFVGIDKAAFHLEHAGDHAALEQAAEDFIGALREMYDSESKSMTRVLLIDDDPSIGFIIRSLLIEELLSVTQVTSAALATQELEHEWSIIFVDLVLPDADGRALLAQIRSLPVHRETPVVVLSAKTGSLVKNECSMYGIDDFIEKPIDPATFAVHVAALLSRARGQELVSAQDMLTGLPNRVGFRRAFERFSSAQRGLVTLAVIDIDHFSALVESQGRSAADRALLLVTQLLRESLRDVDLLARWGNGEFIVACPGLDAVAAVTLLGRASEALHMHNLAGASGTERPLHFSAGVSELSEVESLDYGLLRADQLLYQVRRRGQGWYAHSFESPGDDRPSILVAEDDPVVAAMLLHDLADDYEIVYVADGNAAIAAAAERVFDLVLLDYQMPNCDGVEVIRALRARPEYVDRPILLLTAVGSDTAVEAAFEAGADDYISKPHRRRSLLARLSRHLGRAPARVVSKPDPAPQGVETEVTALFCDISGFTGIAEVLPPRAVLELLNTYFPVIADVVLRHGGTLEKYIGDAVLAVWGVPRASGDDVVCALTAAIEIQRAVRELAKSTDMELEVHIGLNSGPVVAANIGSEELSQLAIVGDTTNLASRVCNLAGPGQIAVTEGTVKALDGRGGLDLGPPQLVDVKGRDEQISIRMVNWA